LKKSSTSPVFTRVFLYGYCFPPCTDPLSKFTYRAASIPCRIKPLTSIHGTRVFGRIRLLVEGRRIRSETLTVAKFMEKKTKLNFLHGYVNNGRTCPTILLYLFRRPSVSRHIMRSVSNFLQQLLISISKTYVQSYCRSA